MAPGLLHELPMRWIAAVVLSGCAFGLPPTRTEVGRGLKRDGAFTHVAVGTHIGGVVPNSEASVEVGGGIVFETDPETTDMTQPSHGGFIDLGAVAFRTEHSRLTVGGRFDHYWKGDATSALKLRVDLEAIAMTESSFSEDEACGATTGGSYGNVGIGVFAEAGPTWFTDDSHGWTATAGVSLRLPAMGFIAIGVGCSDGGHSSGSRGSGGSLSGGWSKH